MLLGACKSWPELLSDFEVVTLVPGRPLRERGTVGNSLAFACLRSQIKSDRPCCQVAPHVTTA